MVLLSYLYEQAFGITTGYSIDINIDTDTDLIITEEDIEELDLSIINEKQYSENYCEEWYIYLVFIENIKTYCVIDFGGESSIKFIYNKISDIKVELFDDFNKASNEFENLGPF